MVDRTVGPNNGAAVRGLRLLRTTEYRRVAFWRTAVWALLGDPSGEEDSWHLLTVSDGPGRTVALRRFESLRDAEEARLRFVDLVANLSQQSYESADFQAVLDGV
ncbi:MAG: hypothetical protein M3R01_09485 [Actinomycetota bacterium]|nr:hypothetical protein [Acidimicrobiia bacterium]MDQ3147142.1 hypothetical protein [Actinomycetota bacterium]